MNPECAYKPAIRLPNKEVITGEHHTVLALRAIDMGFQENIISGNLNYKGKFYSMYPIYEDLVPDIDNKRSAIDFATSCSKGERDACERILKTGTNKKYLNLIVKRWDNLRRLPLVTAAKRKDNGYIYTDGQAHGTIIRLHPDLAFVKTAADTHHMATAGFLHDDGRFLNRKQAAQVSLKLTGIILNEDKMLSGEEWIPYLKDKNDAKDFGNRMHLKGLSIAKQRIEVFNSLKKHQNHVKLLEIATKICERKRAIEIYS